MIEEAASEDTIFRDHTVTKSIARAGIGMEAADLLSDSERSLETVCETVCLDGIFFAILEDD